MHSCTERATFGNRPHRRHPRAVNDEPHVCARPMETSSILLPCVTGYSVQEPTRLARNNKCIRAAFASAQRVLQAVSRTQKKNEKLSSGLFESCGLPLHLTIFQHASTCKLAGSSKWRQAFHGSSTLRLTRGGPSPHNFHRPNPVLASRK